MKKILLSLFACGLVVSGVNAQENVNLEDSTGLPGDHFSLQGALEMFKKASSLEDFEKRLNVESNHVNNLDLNSDGNIDYVKVVDIMKDNAHAIVMRVDVSSGESQDVAVIELEKTGDQSALVQIIGDPELYGDSVILEPTEESEMEENKSGKGPYVKAGAAKWVVVNVWFWPCVKFVYAPAYVVWVSPWYWGYYPGWWKPWRCYSWRWHYHHGWHYHHWYHHHHYYRAHHMHNHYWGHRKASPTVKAKYKAAHAYHKAHKPYKSTGKNVSTKPVNKPKVYDAPNKGKSNTPPTVKQPPKNSPNVKQGPHKGNKAPVQKSPGGKTKPAPVKKGGGGGGKKGR